MPEFVSKGGKWVPKAQEAPEPITVPVAEAVKEDIAKVEEIVKPATKSKPKAKKRKGR